ncbi:desulfoferrodoxin [archaeon]|nr:desulfoferrodoxin [archaeon]
MARINGIYKCNVCGNVVEVLEAKSPEIVCCNENMKLFEEKTEEEGTEKHKPILEIDGEKVKVKVGSVEHPMEDEHWIELIEILGDGKIIASSRPYPGEKPEAEFCLSSTEGISARALCNVHGLWKN